MEFKENILNDSKELKSSLIEIRRELHKHPEVGVYLPNTMKFISSKLKEFGYTPEIVDEVGILATIKGPKEGKTFLLRADMDALPIEEESNFDFKSTNGNMHACGHDMHTTMLLGAAKLLKKYQSEIHGTIKLLFQPDEEGFTGGKRMIKAGVLENPKVNAAMALHVFSNAPSNTIAYSVGTCISSCIKFKITITGLGCHGAMPETGIDPLNIASHVYLALQEIPSREISATDPVVLTIGKFVGGTAANIIPEKVVMEGTIRSLSEDVGRFAFDRVKDISMNVSKAFRGSAVVEEVVSVPPLVNDSDLSEKLFSYTKNLFGTSKIVIKANNSGMGSEDFAAISAMVPSTYFIMGAGTKEENPSFGYPMHHSCVGFNEDILSSGSAMFAYNAIMWLKENL
ncbi:M20 metallopeptidase family protein [Clostridium thermobutyricum]|uniref:Putative hydrolase YxeP n=1 Tax=Clostridium thermobutyricum DSM 4928 TaxID=1121339 RepID=A0A1V4SY82_9CLOT|nr:M20 family metallopeptidase [Clostridium thermobutyricum]OPX49744.1 putative hydrolase YxeP [Clostridium thermobutyricum DSM 4928]